MAPTAEYSELYPPLAERDDIEKKPASGWFFIGQLRRWQHGFWRSWPVSQMLAVRAIFVRTVY
jgi:hypothetical protein